MTRWLLIGTGAFILLSALIVISNRLWLPLLNRRDGYTFHYARIVIRWPRLALLIAVGAALLAFNLRVPGHR